MRVRSWSDRFASAASGLPVLYGLISRAIALREASTAAPMHWGESTVPHAFPFCWCGLT